jgi:hypothetical protein
MARKSFFIHSDFYDELKNFSDKQRGELLFALIEWAQYGQTPKLDAETSILFRLMSAQIERISKVKACNGARGGAPEGNDNAKKTSKTSQTSETSETSKTSKTSENKQNKLSLSLPLPLSLPLSNTNTKEKKGIPEGIPKENEIPAPMPSAALFYDSESGGSVAGKNKDTAVDGMFDEFFTAYPLRVAPKAAKKAYVRAIKEGAAPGDILAGVTRYKSWLQLRGAKNEFIKHPSTWLNGGCWRDELCEKHKPLKIPAPRSKEAANVYAYLEQYKIHE